MRLNQIFLESSHWNIAKEKSKHQIPKLHQFAEQHAEVEEYCITLYEKYHGWEIYAAYVNVCFLSLSS